MIAGAYSLDLRQPLELLFCSVLFLDYAVKSPE
jgi:hypothetical protein